ncbi:phytoene desaturase family protein [Phaeacidiphilus oryzae]|uniref:phytoene desaturase family protein n=1 Tax=Phaeacidiphilus oryzae TaxID=348818 RepID=UPI000565975A|nr:NAD(P)/FAD-dependent oxidoreductase [Phaeacidiphilus oryzae]
MGRIVVIGAGISGLAAAARLARRRHEVVVCESAPAHGGQLGRYRRDGFAFDTGPTLMTLPAVYRDLYLKSGKDRLEDNLGLRPVSPGSHHVLPDGTRFDLANASRAGVVAALESALGPGAGERWAAFLDRGRAVWEATRRPLLEEPLPADPRPLHTDPYPAVRRRLRAPARTVAGIGARELRHPGLAALLDEYAVRFGLDPRTAPASLAVLPYMEQTFGVWYLADGGMRSLADDLLARCRKLGVEFRFGTRVEETAVESGRAAGVRTAGGELIEADAVLDSSPPPAPPAAPSGPVPATGRFTVLLALRGARPEGTPERTVLHAADPEEEREALFGPEPRPCPRPTLQLLRPDDASLAPEGHEAASLTVTVPAQGRVDWAGDPATAERYADALLARAADALGPELGLGERLLWRVVRTPADLERETGAPGGALPPPALAGASGALLAAPNGDPAVPGRYRIGGWAHPGGGLPRAGMSAALAAELVERQLSGA